MFDVASKIDFGHKVTNILLKTSKFWTNTTCLTSFNRKFYEECGNRLNFASVKKALSERELVFVDLVSRKPSLQSVADGLLSLFPFFVDDGLLSLFLFFHLLVEALLPKILTRFIHQHAAEAQQAEQVGNGHPCIHAIGEIPHEPEVDATTNEDADDVNDAVVLGPALSFQVFNGPFAIDFPSENRGECEGEQAEGEQRRTDVGNLAERHFGKRGTVLV